MSAPVEPTPTIRSASVNRNPTTSHKGETNISWATLDMDLTAQPITTNLLSVANTIRTIGDRTSPIPDPTLKLLSETLPELISNMRSESMNHATVGNWLHFLDRTDGNSSPSYICTLLQGTASLIARGDDAQQQNTDPIKLEGRQIAHALFDLQRFSNTEGNSEIEPGLKALCNALAWQAKRTDMTNDHVGMSLSGLQNLTNSADLEPELIYLLKVLEPKIRAATGGLGSRYTASAFIGLQCMQYNEKFGPVLDKTVAALITHIDKLDVRYFDHIIMILKGLQSLPSGTLRDQAIVALTKRIKAMPEIKTMDEWRTWHLERTSQTTSYTTATTLIRMIEHLREPLDSEPTYGLLVQLYAKAGMRKGPTVEELKPGLSHVIYEIRPPTADSKRKNTMEVDFHDMSFNAAQMNGHEALQRYLDDANQTHQMRLVAGRQTHSREGKQNTMWDVVDKLYKQFSDELVWVEAPHSEDAKKYGAAIVKKYLTPFPDFASKLRKERTIVNRLEKREQLEFSFGNRPAMHFVGLREADLLPSSSPTGLWDSMQKMIARSQTESSTGKWRDEGEFVYRGFKFKAVYEAEGQQIKRLKILYEGPVEAGRLPPVAGMSEGKAVLRI